MRLVYISIKYKRKFDIRGFQFFKDKKRITLIPNLKYSEIQHWFLKMFFYLSKEKGFFEILIRLHPVGFPTRRGFYVVLSGLSLLFDDNLNICCILNVT